jgi:hypothetical protein
VDLDAGMAAVARNGDVERRLPARQDPPQRPRRLVAQGRVGTTGQHRRHRLGIRRRCAVAHGVHPSVKEVETPDLEAIFDRLPVETQRAELGPRHHAMLPSRQFGQFRVGCAELT